MSIKNLPTMIIACTAAAALANSFARAENGQLSDLLQQYPAVDSIHLQATVDVRVFSDEASQSGIAGEGRVIEGTYEFRAAGERYRVDSYLDESRFPGMNATIAYDGNRFQMLFKGDSLLILGGADNDALMQSLPNPLVELVQFLVPLTDESASRRVRFKDARTAAAEDTLVAAAAWDVVVDDRATLERTIMPGGTYEGLTYVHHIFVVPGERNRPIRIDRVEEGTDQVISSASFSHYSRIQANGTAYDWPTRVRLIAYQDGQREAEMSFVLHTIQIGVDIPVDVFTIDFNEADTVWDDALEIFVKQ